MFQDVSVFGNNLQEYVCYGATAHIEERFGKHMSSENNTGCKDVHVAVREP